MPSGDQAGVWESEQAFKRFQAERLQPAVAALGGPARPQPSRDAASKAIVVPSGDHSGFSAPGSLAGTWGPEANCICIAVTRTAIFLFSGVWKRGSTRQWDDQQSGAREITLA